MFVFTHIGDFEICSQPVTLNSNCLEIKICAILNWTLFHTIVEVRVELIFSYYSVHADTQVFSAVSVSLADMSTCVLAKCSCGCCIGRQSELKACDAWLVLGQMTICGIPGHLAATQFFVFKGLVKENKCKLGGLKTVLSLVNCDLICTSADI